ncbi:MAG: hypothetical protein DHS20C17_06690 [Cyclobacteriaceae bacterium]|nr:MAG: hypothetical protein DHS20C17_06690 [Cyclobacteriaceae bacterium]
MTTKFKVEPLKFAKIQELPNSWTQQNYIDLLEIMDYGDISDIAPEELKEMCLMSLTDYEPEEAAKIVLEYIFKDRLSKGQTANLSNEMLDEKMWEEYADLSMHEDFFNVHQLLYLAFGGKFPYPEAVSFEVRITANESKGLSIFKDHPETSLIRLLVAGMPENTLINRLFDEQIESGEFKEAKDIIWQFKLEQNTGPELVVKIISSMYWFHDFKSVSTYETQLEIDEI